MRTSAAARIGLVVLALAMVLRAALLAHYPVPPFGDGYTRLVDPTRLVIPPWLPGYQATLALTSMFSFDIVGFRAATAVQGALAAGLGAAFGARRWGAGAGWTVGLALALLPSFVVPSLAPYQEPLFLALSIAGVGLLAEGPAAALGGAALLGLACAVRYEGWPLAGIAGAWLVATGIRGRSGHLVLAGGLALSGIVACVQGLPVTIAGAVGHLELEATPGRLLGRLEILGRLLGNTSTWSLLLPALWGLSTPAGRALALVAVGHVAWLAVLNAYSPADNPRQLVVTLLLLAGMAGTVATSGPRALGIVTLGLLPGVVAWRGALRGYGEGMPTVIHEVARALEPRLGPGDRVLVLAQGMRDWPAVDPVECEALGVLLGRGPGVVVCDSDAEQRVDWIVRLGDFEDWRPVHVATTARLAQGAWHEYADPGGAVRIASPDAGALAEVAQSLDPARLVLPNSARCGGIRSQLELPMASSVLGSPNRKERDRVALYANGEFQVATDAEGHLVVWLCGTPAGGRFPRVTIDVGAGPVPFEVGARMSPYDAGLTTPAGTATVRFDDDAADAQGGDRNVFIGGIEVVARR
ncbi:MAG: hypothetical protein FJ090_13350 [Deltaproteobacteria bacterium]|nr:hypothetical protein [Deltaproteobacteria bacterium]